MTKLILLPNQLFDLKFIDVKPEKIFIYLHKKFYSVLGQPISIVKKNYMDRCLNEFKTASKISIKTISKLSGLDGAYAIDPADHDIYDEYTKKKIIILDSPQFILTRKECLEYIEQNKKNDKLPNMIHFYKYMRNKLNLLMSNNNPLGGKWSFDESNRDKLDHEIKNDKLNFPTNHKDARSAIRSFIKHKLTNFGQYQDAISYGDILYHSGLSPMLNIGLITPQEIIKEFKKLTGDYIKKNLASCEGYIRQLIGWREFMRMVYEAKLTLDNQFESKAPLEKKWYEVSSARDTTQIAPSITNIKLVDYCINKANNHGYLHHIERLMVVGCFMFISKINPDHAFTWFSTQFIDAYEWVMVGNVYFMSQFTRPAITKRPYICSSVYISKMMDDKSKKILWLKEDQDKWDNIYSKFIIDNEKKIKKYYMMFPHIKKAHSIQRK